MAEPESTDTNFQKPPPDLQRLLEVWTTWKAADELPGRSLADLKIACVDTFLETFVGESESAAAQFEKLELWDRGKAGPEETLAALDQNGFGDLIAAAVEALVAEDA